MFDQTPSRLPSGLPNGLSTADRDILRVALVQTSPELGEVDANLAALDDQVSRLAACDLVVGPELSTHGYHLSELDDFDGMYPSDPRLAKLGDHGPVVVTGFVEASRHLLYNSAVVVGGPQVGVQRKLYLPTYRSWEERKHFKPGGKLHAFDPRGKHLGVLICNDLWQAPLPWLAAHAGAEVLVVVANSSRADMGLSTRSAWDIMLAHAAVSLQTYVVFVNRTGQEVGRDFWGGSAVIGPTGARLAQLGEEPGVAECELDLTALRSLRRRWPLLQESRADLVAAEANRIAFED